MLKKKPVLVTENYTIDMSQSYINQYEELQEQADRKNEILFVDEFMFHASRNDKGLNQESLNVIQQIA